MNNLIFMTGNIYIYNSNSVIVSLQTRCIEKKNPYDCFAVTSGMYVSIIAGGTRVSTFLCTLNTRARRSKCNCTESKCTDL